jgi:ferredoxin
MTYIVTESCIRYKYMTCVEVCPVNCFHEGENMLVINPSGRIDCGVCEPERPAEAIKPSTGRGIDQWLELNATFAAQWPNIRCAAERPIDADQYKGVGDKFEKYFSPRPGRGRRWPQHPAS